MSYEKFHAMNRAALHITQLLTESAGASCDYITMTQYQYESITNVRYITDNNYSPLIIGNEYMVITCSNRHRYYVDVTADSVLTACAETLTFAAKKL